jgi:hypothetical protein
MRKTLLLASIMLLLLGMAPAYRGSEGVTNKPPTQMVNLIHMLLKIERRGSTKKLYESLVSDLWRSDGYVNLFFRIPEGNKPIKQHLGTGTAQRIIISAVPGEVCTAVIVYQAEYKVLSITKTILVDPNLPEKKWRIHGWWVRIQESWKNGQAVGQCRGIYGNVSATIGVGSQIIDTYTVKVNLRPPRVYKKSYWQNSIIYWQNKYSAKFLELYLYGGK